ncbi:hypothetical protein ACFSTC_55465 [Nonomuraea ferruginea]
MIYTIAAAVYLPRLGRRATAWAAIALWQAAAASVVASVVLAALRLRRAGRGRGARSGRAVQGVRGPAE